MIQCQSEVIDAVPDSTYGSAAAEKQKLFDYILNEKALVVNTNLIIFINILNAASDTVFTTLHNSLTVLAISGNWVNILTFLH